jgi:hypothetical protein
MKLRAQLQEGKAIGYLFWCPGCKEAHAFRIVKLGPDAPVWQFNGDVERPTFAPSLLYYGDKKTTKRCHLTLVNGELSFLNDCEHALKGKKTALPDWPGL